MNNASYVPICGPGVDALDNRKESDNGPSEAQVTKGASAYFKKYGPPKWSDEVLARVIEMGREKQP